MAEKIYLIIELLFYGIGTKLGLCACVSYMEGLVILNQQRRAYIHVRSGVLIHVLLSQVSYFTQQLDAVIKVTSFSFNPTQSKDFDSWPPWICHIAALSFEVST